MEKIDDRDNSVVYSQPLLGSDWSNWGDPNDYQGTASLTRTEGANAQVTFNGTSIAVYGTVSNSSADSGTTSLYSVDGNTGTEYTTSPTKVTQYQVKFFQSSPLNPGQHTLEVVNESEGGWLWLDYFLVETNATAISSSTLSSSSLPTSSVTASLVPTIVVTSTPSPTDTGSGSHRNNGPNAGIIVGSIFGGIFALLFFFGIFWLVRRRLADRYADEAAAIPTDVPIPAPTSKAAQSLEYTDKVHDSVGYDNSGTPVMAQMHHQHQHQLYDQQPHQQRTRYGSRTSASNLYPFGPTGIAQHAYNSKVGPYDPTPSPRMGMLQQHGRQPSVGPLPHGRTPSSGPGYPTSAGGGASPGDNLYLSGQVNSTEAYGAGGGTLNIIEEIGFDHGSGQSGNGPARPPSNNASPPAYPGVPPGLLDPRAQ